MAVLELQEARAAWLASGREWALFLDIDGTLLDIRNVPDMVIAPPELVDLLERLRDAFDGALALISGRAIEDIDRIFGTLQITCAGVHGAQLRAADVSISPDARDAGFLAHARAVLDAFHAANPGTLVEDKRISLALHTRMATDAQPSAEALLTRLADSSLGRYKMLRGKWVNELIPTGVDKGIALERLLDTANFRGRAPVMIGDDITDEPAFRAAERRGGIAIAVGAGAPDAAHRLETPQDCRRWLRDVLTARLAARLTRR
jgi:trehalose 6-phosphate phosphatase